MGPTSVDPLDRARMIVHGCLERDFCKANSIDTTTHFMIMRHDFERYRDRFQNFTGMESSSQPIDDYRPTAQLSIGRCITFVVFLGLSGIAALLWYAWIQ